MIDHINKKTLQLNGYIFFLVFLGTITFSNQVWATSLNSDLVTTSSLNFSVTVTKVIDGDTLDVTTTDGETITIRLALVDAPES